MKNNFHVPTRVLGMESYATRNNQRGKHIPVINGEVHGRHKSARGACLP